MSFRLQSAALILILLAGVAHAGEKLLTDEDIVRRVITGEPHERIISLIRESAVDFDLSDEMVEEMKLAGVPERIVQVMRERHLELYPPAETETEGIELPALPALVVHLEFKKQPVLPEALTVRPHQPLQLRCARHTFLPWQ